MPAAAPPPQIDRAFGGVLVTFASESFDQHHPSLPSLQASGQLIKVEATTEAGCIHNNLVPAFRLYPGIKGADSAPADVINHQPDWGRPGEPVGDGRDRVEGVGIVLFEFKEGGHSVVPVHADRHGRAIEFEFGDRVIGPADFLTEQAHIARLCVNINNLVQAAVAISLGYGLDGRSIGIE